MSPTIRKATFNDNMGNANRHGLHKSLTLDQRKAIIAQAAERRYAEFEGATPELTGGTADEWSNCLDPV